MKKVKQDCGKERGWYFSHRSQERLSEQVAFQLTTAGEQQAHKSCGERAGQRPCPQGRVTESWRNRKNPSEAGGDHGRRVRQDAGPHRPRGRSLDFIPSVRGILSKLFYFFGGGLHLTACRILVP